MQTVERVVLLKNGPPWGFRLAELYPEGLVVSQIRRQSPAEMAGLRENDHLVAIENISTLGMGRMYAVQLINDANYELELIVKRQERRKQQVMTFFLDTGAARGKQVQQELTTRELTLLWEMEPAPPPPPPRPPSPPRVQPHDPNVTPMTLDKLLREFEVPEHKAPEKKRTFADSIYYIGSAIQYPSLEEQMSMAHKVAESIQAPVNSDSRGFNMFELQRQRADNYVKEGPEPMPDPIENATQEQLQRMPPLAPPPPPPTKSPSFPSMQPAPGYIPPAPPPPPPGQPRSLQEFMEKVRLFPKNQHNQISPQVCFDLASALHTNSPMFAKRRAKAQTWELTNEGASGGPVSGVPQQVVMERPKLVSKLAHHDPPVNSNYLQQAMRKTEVSTVQMSSQSQNTNSGQNTVNYPINWQQNTMISAQTQPISMPKPEAPSQPVTWRPVKFNIPQTAT